MNNDKPAESNHGSNSSVPAPSESESRTGRSNSASLSPVSDDSEQALKSLGRMKIENNQMNYVGNEHWAAILQDINEVKNHLEDISISTTDAGQVSSEPLRSGPELLMGLSGPFTKQDLLAKLPERGICDQLVSSYLNSADPLAVLFHLKTFQSQYERFWRDPIAAPSAWISILWSIICIITLWRTRGQDISPDELAQRKEQADYCRRQACKCLLHSGYLTPYKYTMEAFLMYMGTEYPRSHEIEPNIWVAFGMTVRQAISMGYHRDPSHFSQISPYTGEMRRRVWAIITQLDILTSVQVGLPRMVRDNTSDTRLAGNYQDDDLSEDMVDLPPPRPGSEYTKLSYLITKGKLAKVLGQILDEVDDLNTSSYDEILKLDEKLRAAYAEMPEVLRMKPMKQSVGDKSSLIMRRINMDLIYLKARCILHRKYLTAALSSPSNFEQYSFSRDAAVTAAVTILEHQIAIDSEIQVGGRLANDKWLISALTTNDFTLAAMLICLDLDYRTSSQGVNEDKAQGNRLLSLLEKSSVIWKTWFKQGIASPKAKSASDALSIILEKVKKTKASVDSKYNTQFSNGDNNQFANYEQCEVLHLEHLERLTSLPDVHASESQGNHTTDNTPNSVNYSDQSISPSMQDAIQSMMAAPQDLNWPQWDGLFQPAMGTMSDVDQGLWPMESEFAQGITIPPYANYNMDLNDGYLAGPGYTSDMPL